MSIWRAFKLILTLHCEESARLQSEACERPLSLAERWAVRLHFLSCRACRSFRRQLRFIHQAAQQRQARTADATLPDSLRETIAKRLNQEN